MHKNKMLLNKGLLLQFLCVLNSIISVLVVCTFKHLLVCKDIIVMINTGTLPHVCTNYD